MTIKLRTNGWEIGGERLHWTWGQINYWEIERSNWRDVLRAYKHSGHQVLSTAILPNNHLQASGQYEFGSSKPQLDIAAFLDEVKDCGLKILLWVGPRAVPGITAAGYPKDLLENELALARDGQQQVVLSSIGYSQEIFTLPSLINELLRVTLTSFAEGLKPVLEPYIHPDGPIIGIGLTNAPGWENALQPYHADYHPDSINMFRQFLKKKYVRISLLNKAYFSDYAQFKEIVPPIKWMGNEQKTDQLSVDWARYKEEYFVRAAELLHEVFSCLTFDRIPIYLATCPTAKSPVNFNELEKTRCFDYIMPDFNIAEDRNMSGWDECALYTRYLILFNQVMDVEEHQAEEQHYQLLKAISRGVRGIDAINPVGAGSYQGFITNREGKPNRYHHGFWQVLQDNQSSEGFLDSQLYADVILLSNPELERAINCYKTTIKVDSEEVIPNDHLGNLDEQSRTYLQTKNSIIDILKKHQFAFLPYDGEGTLNRLNKNQLILVLSRNELSSAMQVQVNQLVSNGHDVLVVGMLPEAEEDSKYTPLQELLTLKTKKVMKKKRVQKQGKLHHLDELDETKLMRLFKNIGIQRPIRIDEENLEIRYHKLRNRLFISIQNDSENQIETIVRKEGKFVLKDFWDNNKFLGGNNEIQVSLLPKSIKIWELISC